MMMRSMAMLGVCLLGVTGAAAWGVDEGVPSTQAGVNERPNIVFIFADDHATAALSCYDSAITTTPNLDRLADEGMVFDSCFCTNGICAPSRAVVLTGVHSHINGLTDNGKRFDGSQPTFPKMLQAAGYQTAMIGKWHLKTDPTGFDYWEILPGQGYYYGPDFRTPAGRKRYDGYVTDITTDLAIDWLRTKRSSDEPFLLMCQHKAPHRPWMPGPAHHTMFDGAPVPEPSTLLDDYATRSDAARMQEMTIANHMYLFYDLKVMLDPSVDPSELKGADRWMGDRLGRMNASDRAAWERAYGPRTEAFHAAELSGDDLTRWKYQRYITDYLRCIASVDDNVGRLLDELDELGLSENTIVVYSSDQGFFLGEHGWYDKRFMYEPSLRMPLMVRWPGVVAPGTRNADLVQNLDFAATFLDVAGVPIPERFQGESLRPLLEGTSPEGWRDAIYYEYFEVGIHAVEPHYGVRTDHLKLMHFPRIDAWEFYDLRTDPDEVRNRIDDPTVKGDIERLRRVLDELRVEYDRVSDHEDAAKETSS